MKKLFLLLLVLPLAFFACGDDDDKDPDKMTIEEYMSEDRPFKWNGDWNDPSDPNYKKDGYNPLADGSYWQSVKKPDIIFLYTKDFKNKIYVYDEDAKTLKYDNQSFDYIINDKAYQFKDEKGNPKSNVAYLISEDKKTYYENYASLTGTTLDKRYWNKYVKFDISGLNIIE